MFYGVHRKALCPDAVRPAEALRRFDGFRRQSGGFGRKNGSRQFVWARLTAPLSGDTLIVSLPEKNLCLSQKRCDIDRIAWAIFPDIRRRFFRRSRISSGCGAAPDTAMNKKGFGRILRWI